MPGVVVTTAVRTGPTNAQVTPTATLFVAGVTERGPEGKAIAVTSIAEYEAVYGGYTASGWVQQTLASFFEEGGARAFVSRVIPDDAFSATLELDNASADVCMSLTAAGEGTWANAGGLKASVTNTGSAFKVQILLGSQVVYTTSTHTTVSDAVDEINGSGVAGLYVTASAGPNSGLPVTIAASNFSGGLDGGAIDDSDLAEALAFFIDSYGPGAVAAPGFYSSDNYDKLISHAVQYGRIALLGFDRDDSASAAASTAAGYADVTGAEYAAFFYPWVKVPNGNLTSVIPCEGYVAAKRAKVHNESGPWSAYAGAVTEAKFVTAPYNVLSSAEEASLVAAAVNPIKFVNGTVRIYGARSVSDDTANFRFINGRETLNYIVYEAKLSLESLVFQPIDGRRALFARIGSTLTAIMDRIRQAGGVYEAIDANGKLVDPGYSVVVNDSLNPVSQLASGTIRARVGARISSIGETIEVEIVKSNLTASLV
ncbi:MAG: hypothetical protein EBT80_00125 [Chitinophagales bacterium]|nr:hypothetical protein [Chitinophagales bacterium]